MKKIKVITLLVTAALTSAISMNALSATITEKKSNEPFKDIQNSYAKDSIINLHSKGIMNGTTSELFSPTKKITRAEFITTLVRLLRLEPSSSMIPAYKDVAPTSWYYGSIQTATELALTEGTGGAMFEPSKPITRQEAATWIIRALKQKTTNSSSSTDYTDNSAIASWARPYVSTITKLGLMKGSEGKFYPNQDITRQETAVLLDRLLQNNSWSTVLESTTQASKIQMGWQYGQTNEEYEQSIMKSNVNVLSPRWFFLESDKTIKDYTNSSLVTWAKKNGKKIWPLLGNRSSQETTHQFLSSSERTAAAIQKIKSLVTKYDFDGINIDFENVLPADRENFSKFVSSLSEQLHSIGAVVSVDVSPDLGSDWTEAFDYRLLGQKADYLVLMGYDEHWSGGSTPGPVASLSWVQSGLDTLLKQVPAEKVILALPLYNRDWTLNRNGTAVSSEDISLVDQDEKLQRLGVRAIWDSKLGQYTGDYSKNGITHRIWLEEARSLSLKYRMATDRKIAGFAYWSIGGETTDIWTSLRNTERYASYSFK
ncbi:S-layer homology domain-containing protein [Paenibacillus segetis]|uniref:Glycoside hydrolase n=1 Tax=Paenibacillus segetis TaxID=1325360 RepID=A0ABQ1YIF9_9BACL|nr:S-layer homology domain-containing protein [Paenibacillus segetis]GGH26149.1 hypothetical protein GCM10008013_26830 [Paenibacillus segetis]